MAAPTDARRPLPRFDAFVARKSAEADAAAIAPLVTERASRVDSLIAIGNDWSRRLFDGDFYLSPLPRSGLPATSLVFVQSREGNTVATDPATLGGGNADKHLIYEGLSRVAADAVLGGAGTLRDGHIVQSIWRRELVELRATMGLPRHPIQVVATVGGVAIDDGLMYNVPELPVIVITTAAGASRMQRALAARPWIGAIVMDTPAALAPAFRELRARGIARISCIGGRTLADALLDAGLVQDLYLTTTPKSAGEPDTPLAPRAFLGKEVVRKRGTGPDQGVIFEHLRLQT